MGVGATAPRAIFNVLADPVLATSQQRQRPRWQGPWSDGETVSGIHPGSRGRFGDHDFKQAVSFGFKDCLAGSGKELLKRNCPFSLRALLIFTEAPRARSARSAVRGRHGVADIPGKSASVSHLRRGHAQRRLNKYRDSVPD